MIRKALRLLALFAVPVVLVASPTDAAPGCLGEQATIVGERFHVVGTPGDDVIIAADDALIESKGGDDLICAGGRFTEVYAGAGDDRYAGTAGEDLVDGQAGTDVVELGGGPDLLTDTDRGDDVYEGGPGVDVIRFGAPYAWLQPPVRVDLGRGRSSGHGRDRLRGFEHVAGTGKRDVIRGSAGDDYLDGVRGGDKIVGGAGDDVIFGARLLVTEIGIADRFDGSDRALRGGAGDDRIYGGAGPDRLSGGPGTDLLDGGGPRGDRPGDGGDGGGGHDRCRGLEAERNCEQP